MLYRSVAKQVLLKVGHYLRKMYITNPMQFYEFNEEALKLAVEYDLPQTAGSDAHKLEHIGQAAVLSEYEIKTSQDYINLLKNRQAVIYRKPKEPLEKGE